MPFEIDLHCLRIGDCCDHQVALGLSHEQRLSPQLTDLVDGKQSRSLPIGNLSDDRYQQRLVTILDETRSDLDVDWLSGPVCLLMPYLGENNSTSNQQLFTSFCQVIPALSDHPQCHLFPCGRSALLLAWRQIESLLIEKQYPEVWVLAVDSDPRLSLPLSGGDEAKGNRTHEGIASEGVILARFRASETGLSRSWFSYEAQTRNEATSVAVEAIFRRYRQSCEKPVFQFYAPFNGTAQMVEEWATVYHHLSPRVGKQTQVVMTGALTGELGACSGLYNLLHLYARHQNGDYLYNTLQLETSERLFRSAALYTWHQ